MTDPNTPAGATPPSSYPPAAPQPYASAPPPAYGGPAQATIPGKTLGIVAFVLAVVPVGLQLVGLILGIVALVQSRKAGHKNGWALAAIIVSAVLLVLTIIGIIIAVSVAGAATAEYLRLCAEYGSGVHTIEGVQVTLTCN